MHLFRTVTVWPTGSIADHPLHTVVKNSQRIGWNVFRVEDMTQRDNFCELYEHAQRLLVVH